MSRVSEGQSRLLAKKLGSALPSGPASQAPAQSLTRGMWIWPGWAWGARFSVILHFHGSRGLCSYSRPSGFPCLYTGTSNPSRAGESLVRGNALKGPSAVPALGVATHRGSFLKPLELMPDLGTQAVLLVGGSPEPLRSVACPSAQHLRELVRAPEQPMLTSRSASSLAHRSPSVAPQAGCPGERGPGGSLLPEEVSHQAASRLACSLSHACFFFFKLMSYLCSKKVLTPG